MTRFFRHYGATGTSEMEDDEKGDLWFPGFADMVAFFEHRLKVMVKRGDLSEAVIDTRRDFYGKMPIA